VERLKDMTVQSNASRSFAARFTFDTGMEKIVKLFSVRKLQKLNIAITLSERRRKTALWPLSEQISDSRSLL
jgi:hypothetical protein